MIARRLLLFAALLLLGALASLVNPQGRRALRPRPPGRAQAGPVGGIGGAARDRSVSLPRADGRPVVARLGDRVQLRVHSSQPDTASVDGYDAVGSTDPDSPAELDFVAEKVGRFSVRLVGAGSVVGRLVVRARP